MASGRRGLHWAGGSWLQDGGFAALVWAAALEIKTALVFEAEALVPKWAGRRLIDLFP